MDPDPVRDLDLTFLDPINQLLVTVNLRGHEEGDGLHGQAEHCVVHEAQKT